MGLDRHEIATQLRRDITSGKYRSGDKLPGYRQLAKMFGAAPNTVGEAVRILSEEGLIATKTASRAVVLSPDDSAVSGEDRVESARDELREVQSELHHLRQQVAGLEDRVSDALSKLTE
ncbi:GntR family transcriptional regulator [Haloechinothrix sp. YIM 98757]|uniref:GntR family transcriptional regulator n=1 Tax=Haloechinothrix aidingensis TaxID=2752311 RepID=A0A838ADD5_9PSEU|nr:GntR family transcriptional regulator [Haloechinothrix aidingensis]MBA0127304.1 GntR family transcriptional regulator [Haloechinothrix aidingensis]